MEKISEFSFHRMLKEHGLKSTRQRDQIIQVFIEAGEHLSVDDLYQRVRQRNPRIGYATVYRTLRLMAESGWASARQFGDRIARFEHRAEGRHHDHLICLVCGKIVEFTSKRIENLQSRIARKKGFRIFEHKLELYGHCPDCLSKKEATASETGKKGKNE
jgi:Fur family ferric uptake transcriptional regulator